MVVGSDIPALGRQKQEDLWALLAGQPRQVGELSIWWETLCPTPSDGLEHSWGRYEHTLRPTHTCIHTQAHRKIFHCLTFSVFLNQENGIVSCNSFVKWIKYYVEFLILTSFLFYFYRFFFFCLPHSVELKTSSFLVHCILQFLILLL